MANKHGDNLRKIAGIRDTKGGLDAAKDRSKLPGQRSTAYIDSTGQNATATSGTNNGSYSNYSSPSANYNGSSSKHYDTGSNTQGGELSGGSGQGVGGTGQPGGETGNEATASNDLMNKSKDPMDPISTLTYSSPNPLSIIDLTDNNRGPGLNDGTRTDVVGDMFDPVTGKEFNILYGVDQYLTPYEWLSWNDSGTVPDPTFALGYYYTSSVSSVKKQTATEHVDIAIQSFLDTGQFTSVEFLEYDPEIPPAPATGPFIATARLKLIGLPPNFSETLVGVSINRFACGPGDPSEPGDYCSIIPPEIPGSLDTWPVDGIIHFIAGQSFIASTFDSDALGFTQSGFPKLKYNMGEGRTGEVAYAADGSTLYYETVNDVPTGNFKKLNMDGALTDVGPVSELNAHLIPQQG